MTLREILELLNSKGWNKAKIAKEKLPFGEKKLAELLDELGFIFSNIAPKGWSYQGKEAFLDDDIMKFVGEIKTTKPKAKENSKSKSVLKKEIAKEEKNKTTNVKARKRASFDIDVEVLKRLRIYAIKEEKNTYEIVEKAIIKYLEEVKINKDQ